MKPTFAALNVHADVGGMERFNRRIPARLSELAPSQGIGTSAIAFWNSPQQPAGAPPSVGFMPGPRGVNLELARFTRR